MLPNSGLQYFKTWLGIGWLLVVFICYLSLTSNPPDFNIKFKYIDKAGHFIAYFILMGWFAQLYKTPSVRFFYVLFFVSMGILLEVLQGLGGIRYFEYYDMLANALGAIFAWKITQGSLSKILFYIEKKLFNRYSD